VVGYSRSSILENELDGCLRIVRCLNWVLENVQKKEMKIKKGRALDRRIDPAVKSHPHHSRMVFSAGYVAPSSEVSGEGLTNR
jgi:hypothetical protein